MYAENNTPTVHCWRCGAVAQSNTRCVTPGCVDWNGSNETSDVPPTPWELADAAARLAVKFWKQQAEVYG